MKRSVPFYETFETSFFLLEDVEPRTKVYIGPTHCGLPTDKKNPLTSYLRVLLMPRVHYEY